MSSAAACSSSQPVSSGDVIIIDDILEPPPSKRKLNFDNEPGACDALPPTLTALANSATSDEDLAQTFEDIAANQGIDTIIDIPTTPPINLQDTSNIVAEATSEPELGMDLIEKEFQAATIRVLMKATEGLNTNTLRDPHRRAQLEDISTRLPPLVPGVDKARELLLQLITISQHLQLAHAEFEGYSAQKKTELDEAQRELTTHVAVSKNQNQEKMLVCEKREAKEKLIASLTAQLNDATTALKAIQEEEEQLAHTSSKYEADGKKWNETIAEATTGVEQVASNLQVKIANFGQNVNDLLESLKTWSASSN
ncbi:hypothetical protein ABZP36_004821 [Zizania latifolia]